MECSNVRRLLSPLHAEALELEALGCEPGELAQLLDVDPRAVEPLLRIARAKFAALELLDGVAPNGGELRRTLGPGNDEEVSK
jgi:hypothetical protein